MLRAAELLIVAYAVFMALKVYRQGVALNLLGLAAWLTLIGLCALVYQTLGWIAESTLTNIVAQIAAPVILCQIFLVAAAPAVFRRFRPETGVVAARLLARFKIARWLDRGLCAVLSLFLLACAGTMLLLFVSAAGEAPGLRERIERDSFVLRLFLTPQPATAEDAARRGLSESDSTGQGSSDLRDQREYLDRIGAGMANARDAVAEKTGSKKLRQYTRALNTLLNLSLEENQLLLSHHTELLPLIEHPALLEIVQSERIMSLIDEVARGSPSALYKLGDEPAITALFEDARIKRLLLELDLVEMEGRIQRWRDEKALILAPSWSLSEIEETWQLNSRLKSIADWRAAPSDAASLTWPAGARIGLARTTLRPGPDSPAGFQISVKADGQITALVNDQSVSLTTQDDGSRRFNADSGTNATQLVLMIVFRRADAGRASVVTVRRTDVPAR